MIRVIHVSDLHFGKDTKKARKLLQKIVSKYPFQPRGPNYLLVTGDITDGGHEEEYALAQVALEPFAPCLMLVPGNHDYGTLGLAYSKECVNRFNRLAFNLDALGTKSMIFKTQTLWVSHLVPYGWTRNSRCLQVIGLTSPCNSRTSKPLDFAQGCIGNAQLKRLKEVLENKKLTPQSLATPEIFPPLRLVCLHHRPLHENYTMKLRDSAALWKIITNPKYGIDVVAYGHAGSYQKDASVTPVVSTYSRADGGHLHLVNANSCVSEGSANLIEVVDGVLSVKREVL